MRYQRALVQAALAGKGKQLIMTLGACLTVSQITQDIRCIRI